MVRRLEALEHAFSSASRAVGVLGPVVQPLVPPVLHAGQHPPHSGRIARELIGNHHPRLVPVPVHYASKESLGGFLVAPRLDQDVEHDPVLIDRPPQPVLASVALEL